MIHLFCLPVMPALSLIPTSQGYLSEMPFLALPFEERSKKQQLNSLFKVRSVVFLLLSNMYNLVVSKLSSIGLYCLRKPFI